MNIGLELLRVTEAAALAACPWVGSGTRSAVDNAAIEAMAAALSCVAIDGLIVLGEDEQSELGHGQRVGSGLPPMDVAIDAIDGSRSAAGGGPHAMSVVAVCERGAMLPTLPCARMDKLAVGPDGVGVVDIDRSATVNLHALAKAMNRPIGEVTAVVLDRDRHHELIAEIQRTGARLHLVADDDIGAAITTCLPTIGADILFGVGGSRETVISAAALRGLGGELQSRFAPANSDERDACEAAGFAAGAVLTAQDLVGDGSCWFAATGVTDGDLLRGVRQEKRWLWTDSLIIGTGPAEVRRVRTRHQLPPWEKQPTL
ncbi:MAG: class II fructose-bisphosphatase [Ilumatobacteraceae bacterium]